MTSIKEEQMKKAIAALAVGAVSAAVLSGSVAAAGTSATLNVRTTALGRTLVDGHGRTLYMFRRDHTNMSNCSGACLSVWPALTVTLKPRAAGGAVAGKIGTIRAHGQRQATYGGHPLYYYVGDRKPGDVRGEGLDQFGGKWYAMAPSGRVIDHD
jgi:predicted lipoprotein with Yx(FWY)xxD motif